MQSVLRCTRRGSLLRRCCGNETYAGPKPKIHLSVTEAQHELLLMAAQEDFLCSEDYPQ
jgi:hypothetical protein